MVLRNFGRLHSSARRAGVLGCLAGFALALTGCGQFFPPITSGGGGTSSGDNIYIGNLGTSTPTIAGLTIASSAVSAISGSDWNSSYSPDSMVVTQNDEYLFMGSDSGEILSFPINSSGGLGSGTAAASVIGSAMAIDTSGNWLIVVDLSGDVYAYGLDSSNGTLTSPLSSGTAVMNGCSPTTNLAGGTSGIVVAPSDNYIYVTCGTAGVYTFSFDSSSGDLTSVNSTLTPKQSGDADYGIAVAPSGNYLYVAETGIGALRAFSISSSNGTLSETTTLGSPYKTATGAYGVLVDSTGSYVYVTNRTQGTISGFSIGSTGALTAISGSPFATGTLPQTLIEDKSDTYIAVACAGGNPDLEIYTIGTGGALTSFKSETTGTDPTQATSLAASH